MAKFKVGDKVRVLDGSNIPDYTYKWVMSEYVGAVGDITFVDHLPDGVRVGYLVDFHDGEIQYTFDESCLELAENKKIVIIKKDDSITARLYSAEKLVKETNVDSTGDFNKDANDAFESLYEKYSARDIIQEIYDSLPDIEKKVLDSMVKTGCSKKPETTVKICKTISYKEFRWDDFRDGKTAIKVSSNRQLEEILDYFYRRYPSPASRPVVMFDLKNFDTDISERSLQYYIYVTNYTNGSYVYIGTGENLHDTNVTKTIDGNYLWVSRVFTHKWDSFINGFTALYFDEDNIDKILYTLNCKGYTWKDGESPIPTEYKPPVERGYICMRDGYITWCSESQTKQMFEDETSHITEIVRPR